MMAPGNVLHATMVRDERMMKEVLGLARPRPGGPIQLGREHRGVDPVPQPGNDMGGGGFPPGGGGAGGTGTSTGNRRRGWSWRSVLAR